jgi:hypothetical protein
MIDIPADSRPKLLGSLRSHGSRAHRYQKPSIFPLKKLSGDYGSRASPYGYSANQTRRGG